MRTPLRLLAVVAAGASLLPACGEEQGTRDSLIESLADPAGEQEGFSVEVATCIADGIYERFSGDELDAISGAETAAELPAAVREAIPEITGTCTAGG